MKRRVIVGALLVGAVVAAGIARSGLSLRDARQDRSTICCHMIGPVPGDVDVHAELVLRPRDAVALERFLDNVTDTRSAHFATKLSASAFGTRFGPPSTVLERIEARLRREGIEIVRHYPQRTAIGVRARASSLRRVFGVELATFRDEAGRTFRMPTRTPTIPPELRRWISDVAGLNGRPIPISSASARGGLKPADIASAYRIAPLWRRGIRGQGQTIAVISFATFDPADIAEFQRISGLNGPPIERVPVNGGTNDTRSVIAEEVALDLQVVRGLAPEARILNYEVPYRGLSSFTTGVAAAIDAVVRDGRADIVSISYGICDAPTFRDGSTLLPDADRLRTRRAIEAAVAAGISIFAPTQDQGAYACQRLDLADHRLTTAWPGNNPGVVSVGGTLLSVAQDGSYVDEAGWEDILSTSGGGGGLNPHELRPSWQQAPGVDNPLSDGHRQVPDVSAVADPDSGVLVVFGGEPRVLAGTSASTPLWAASVLLTRQFARRFGVRRLGFVAPLLYQLAREERGQRRTFHDVVRGGNRFHLAGPGWDYATGLGSPDVARLAVAVTRLRLAKESP